jgi:integrase
MPKACEPNMPGVVDAKGWFSLFTRTRYQYGSLETKERKNLTLGANANAERSRYEQEEMPERYSTRAAYQSYIKNQIRPRWADTPMSAVKLMAVEDWLKNLALAPKTKSHVRSLMHTIFQFAERWELIDKNPIKLVRVKGGTKRLKTPRVLALEQFHSLLPLIREPFRTMVLIAGCLGLRVGEIVALQWRDFDFTGLTLLIQRSVVHGRIGDVKTEYSRDAAQGTVVLHARGMVVRQSDDG